MLLDRRARFDAVLDDVRRDKVTSLSLASVDLDAKDKVDELLDALRGNTSLKTLYGGTPLFRYDSMAACQSICAIRNLKEIYLRPEILQGDSALVYLLANSRLERLHFGFCNLKARSLIVLASAIQDNTTLRFLNLSINLLSIEDETDANSFECFGRALSSSVVEDLDLDGNKIETQGLVALRLENITTLQKLSLNNARLGSGFGQVLRRTLTSSSCCWTDLCLGENDLSGDNDMQDLSFGVGQCESMNMLRVNNCAIGDTGSIHLSRQLLESPLCNLVTVYMKQNNVTDRGALDWAEVLRTNKSLRHLSLDDNKIGYTGAEALCQSMIESNVTLHRLVLDGNPICDFKIKRSIRFYSKLNVRGRYVLGDTEVPLALWPHILATMRVLLDVRFYFLQQKPELFQRHQ